MTKDRKISDPAQVSTANSKHETAAQLFSFLANPSRLSAKFRVGGGNCLGRLASVGKSKVVNEAPDAPAAEPDPTPPAPSPPAPTGKCGGNCGKGKGGGGGNGTPNEGKGNK